MSGMDWKLDYLQITAQALPQAPSPTPAGPQSTPQQGPQTGPQKPPMNPQDQQLAQEYQKTNGGIPAVDGAVATIPPPAPGLAPINVVQIIWKAVRTASSDLARNGITHVKLDHLPGKAVGLNKSNEPHVIHLDPWKIGTMQAMKAIRNFSLKHNQQDNTPKQQRISMLNKLIQDSIQHESLATIYHEDEHEEQFRTLLKSWQQRGGGPLSLQVPEGPAYAREQMAGAEPIVT